MPTLLKRLIFQVGNIPNERASAFSSVSNDGHFVSIRQFAKPQNDAEKQFPFEWAFAGTNKAVSVNKVKEGVVKQDFDFEFDSNVYLKTPNTHRGTIETLWEDWDSGCIAETGEVFPNGADKAGVPFFELWQPVDPTKEELVIAETANGSGKSIVLKVKAGSAYDGMLVVTGNWTQGYLAKGGDHTTKGLNFIRLLEKSEGLETIFKYGTDSDKFPTKLSKVSKGDNLDVNGVQWEVLEAHY